MKMIRELMEFLDNGLTSYHAIKQIKENLNKNNCEQLSESKVWSLETGKSYFCIRNDSSLMAFRIPDCDISSIKGFHVYAAHSDSPAFKIKENPQINKENVYVSINTEKYGGMILSTWMDRPLTIAGRVCVEDNDKINTHIIKLKDNICMIPNLAIHMNREVNSGYALNPQTDMLPLMMMKNNDDKCDNMFNDMLADELSTITGRRYNTEDILAYDLFVENCEKAVLAGVNDEFIMSSRYDDLACVFAGMKALLESKPKEYIDILAVFDNEEVGSITRQGADSTFFRDILCNIANGLSISDNILRTWIAESFLVSADNAHACHPNIASKADPTNKPYLNNGIVLKYHGGQKYATDAFSAAYIKQICKKADIPLQTYANRSDITGGSTLGNIAMSQISMAAADIGLPQLAMHSAYETAGIKDVQYLEQFAEYFFNM